MQDVILIGSGIMSANLGAMLKCLDPKINISLFEVTDHLAQEATKSWNNAGTGHAGICELYFTPDYDSGGEVDISKAVSVFAQFEQSLQFWAYAVREGMIDSPEDFISPIPHLSFVKTQEQVDYLESRYRSMSKHHFFRDMEFTTDRQKIKNWAPLLLQGRNDTTPIAVTKMNAGTEINFGCVAEKLIHWLDTQPDCDVHTSHRVTDLKEIPEGWQVTIKNLKSGESFQQKSRFVFVGAGGSSLPLLQKAGITECKGYGGFPIGGQWLVCKNQAIVDEHHAKVYGQQGIGSSPATALPHLDTRIIDGERSILFGPFATVTTKFNKVTGSFSDLPFSIRTHNIGTLVQAGLTNIPIVNYLLQQATQTMATRMKTLRQFYPDADPKDWHLIDAGIRVQVIKNVDGEAVIHYDTEILSNTNRSISSLLGASPGASISTNLMLGVIKECLPHLLESPEAQGKIDAMIPCHARDITMPEEAGFHRKASQSAAKSLKLI